MRINPVYSSPLSEKYGMTVWSRVFDRIYRIDKMESSVCWNIDEGSNQNQQGE